MININYSLNNSSSPLHNGECKRMPSDKSAYGKGFDEIFSNAAIFVVLSIHTVFVSTKYGM